MHLIQQHTFDIQCTSQAFGQEVQSQLSGLLEQSFYPKLELLFRKYDVPQQYWTIEVLEIEIPELSKRYWKEDLIQKMLQQVEAYLTNNLPHFFSQTNDKVQQTGNFSGNATKQMEMKKRLFFFLKEGFLPSTVSIKNIEDLIQELDFTSFEVAELLQLFKADFNALVRWVFVLKNENFKTQYSKAKNEALFIEIKNIWFPLWINEMKRFPIDHKSILKSLNTAHKNQWEELLFWATVLFQEQQTTELFSKLNGVLQRFFSISMEELRGSFRVFTSSRFSQPLLFSKGFSTATTQFIQTWETTFIHLNTNTLETVPLKMDYLDKKLRETEFIKENTSFFINNAGLVLLHPFLDRLFAMNGWTNEREWVDYEALQKGILSLHFLVYGEQPIDESQLILNKIICGLAINEVVDVAVSLTSEEKEKCVNLLEAVLEHWHIIKGSSKEALQETFLQREGKIELLSEGYELWIKDHGADILLEQVPWGISMFKTPWMEHYMNCHWSQ